MKKAPIKTASHGLDGTETTRNLLQLKTVPKTAGHGLDGTETTRNLLQLKTVPNTILSQSVTSELTLRAYSFVGRKDIRGRIVLSWRQSFDLKLYPAKRG